MKGLVEYKIPYQGIKDGKHYYSYEIDRSFFDVFENPDGVEQAALEVAVELDKSATMLVLDFTFNGNISVPCDRCNDPVSFPLEGQKERLIVKFNDASLADASEDILVLHIGEDELDLSAIIFEYVTLLTPRFIAHPEDECNEEVIQAINSLSVEPEENEENQIDPRWADLDSLKNKFK